MAEKLELLVDGGAATPGPPLGPALGPLGVNIVQIVAAINEKTREFKGMKVPVKLTIDTTTKAYTVEVGTPPASALIIKEAGIEKGGGKSSHETAGNITMAQAVRVAKMKQDSLLGVTFKKRVKEVVGTCVSMGVTVEGKNPKDVLKDIDAGFYNELLIEK
jgi:large subunit ribosomal protein L11